MRETEHTAGHSRPSKNGQQRPKPKDNKGGDFSPGSEGRFRPLLQFLLNTAFLIRRPLTMGVRAAAFDSSGRIFLVRHTYVPGWHMPGGGVEPGETVYETLARELSEEGQLSLTEPAELYGLYHNKWTNRRDHVAFFICRNVVQFAEPKANMEIKEAGFFALDNLPSDISAATRRRLVELSGDGAISTHW